MDNQVALAFGLFLFFTADSLLAFKVSFTHGCGIFLILVGKLIYKSPRPFWANMEIMSIGGICDFDFAAPSSHLFNVQFFVPYCIFTFLVRYTNDYKPKLVYSLITLNILIIALVIYIQFAFGQTFLYQCIVTTLYSTTYLIACINWDQELLNYCEKVGFIIKSSRRAKFDILFLCCGLFFVVYVLAQAQETNWTEQ